MSNQATILFENDPLIAENEALKQFVENSSATVNPLPFVRDGELVVVVKLKEDESYENVRHIAGTISRVLSKRKVENASLTEESLIKAFESLVK